MNWIKWEDEVPDFNKIKEHLFVKDGEVRYARYDEELHMWWYVKRIELCNAIHGETNYSLIQGPMVLPIEWWMPLPDAP